MLQQVSHREFGAGVNGHSVWPGDSELMNRIKSGDEDALALTMEKYSSPVFSAAFRVLRRHPDAQEVTQDVFWALWRSPDRFEAARGSLVTWLVILSRSRALDLVRRLQANAARTCELTIQIVNQYSNSANPVTLDEKILFEELIGRLPENQGCVVQRVYLEGYALSEVAAQERAPLGTIKGRARFAIKRLRSDLLGQAQKL